MKRDESESTRHSRLESRQQTSQPHCDVSNHAMMAAFPTARCCRRTTALSWRGPAAKYGGVEIPYGQERVQSDYIIHDTSPSAQLGVLIELPTSVVGTLNTLSALK
jgi:hypothetical protein